MSSETLKLSPVRLEVKPDPMLQFLVRLLSNEYLLRSKTLNYSWNARRGHLKDLQEICHDFCREMDQVLEEAAELIQKRKGYVPGSLSEVLAGTTLSDCPGHYVSARTSATELAENHREVIREIDSFRAQLLEEQHILNTLTRNWRERHSQMAATLDAIGKNRLHLH
jgi:DNA-binding ferritin-like protein